MGNASSCSNSIETSATPIKMYLNSLPAHPKLLNFSAINCKGATSKKEKTITTTTITDNVSHEASRNNNDEMKSAFAGVGKPIKESL